MPRLDGFELCLAVRGDARLAGVPIVLVTNSYIESADRELARHAGADDMVLRTPELREAADALRLCLGAVRRAATSVAPSATIDRERARRVMTQLERQVALNAGANQRCTLLSAELSVLSAISEALARQQDIDEALTDALAACFDAGGISMGALYLRKACGAFRVLSFGGRTGWTDLDLEGFFGDMELLREAMSQPFVTTIPSGAVPDDRARALLGGAGVSSMLIAPLGYHDTQFGALLMVSATTDLRSEDRMAFAQAVAGQISQALVMAQAFEAKETSEREARAQAAVLRSVLESIADGVAVANERGELILWNSAAEALTKVDPSLKVDELGRRFEIFAADKVTPLALDDFPIIRAMRGEDVDGLEVFLRHDRAPDGVWLSVNGRPLREDGRVRGGVTVFRDVTQEKAAQAQLMVSDRMASVGMLAAGVAHEINNPLTAVLANLELAQRELSMASERLADLRDASEMLADAREAAERVKQIVRDLRMFSRKEDETHGAVDVEAVLDSSLRMAQNEIRHRARLETVYGKVPPARGSESRLGQLFLNLIVNAAQAIDEGNARGHTIRVTTSVHDSGRIAIEITDTGMGIPPEILRQLFTPFFTTKPASVGTGLGLAICQRIVTNLGGEILVESEVGKGTTFRVFLLPATTIDVSDVASAPSAGRASRRARVLVIDDEALIRTLVRRALSAEHDVTTLDRAAEALERIVAGESFDIILCDLMMPQMTGMELHAELVHKHADHAKRMIFLTGGAFTPGARGFLDGLTNQRVEKPFDVQHLRALVNDRIR
jgi:signal transduction histidine kinase/DNA-binding response OmpR family regulator